jgi:hypothetical protein
VTERPPIDKNQARSKAGLCTVPQPFVRPHPGRIPEPLKNNKKEAGSMKRIWLTLLSIAWFFFGIVGANATDHDGSLILAVKNGNMKEAETALSYGADIDA